MSLATNIKEFADVLHNIQAEQLTSLEGTDIISDGVLPLAIPKIAVLQQLCFYAVKSFGEALFYFLSFQWLRDFSYFPLSAPEITHESSINHDTFLASPFSYLFSFAKNGVALSSYTEGPQVSSLSQGQAFYVKEGFINSFFKTDQLFAGFVNSFFFSFPFSLPHLITLRRMFSQGVAAAAASLIGTIIAHSLLLVGVIYGIRFLVIPYYSLQPLTFLIGLVTVAIIITEFVKEKRIYLVPLTHYPSLIRIGVLNFVIALCESATVFHDLHHLTLNSQITYLQLYDSQNALDSFFIHLVYLIAFVLGHAIFSILFGYLILKGAEKVCSFTGWTLPETARRMNRALLVAILTFTFSSFPYYGLDYLITKSAGFLPEDPAYLNTIFSPTQIRSRSQHFKSKAPPTKDSKTPVELDLNYFDRGMYLSAPKEEKEANDPDTDLNTDPNTARNLAQNPARDRAPQAVPHSAPDTTQDTYPDTNIKLDINSDIDSNITVKKSKSETFDPALSTEPKYDPPLTFEELNYQGESAWLMRQQRARSLPEEQNSKKESVFEKPKSHFKQLRLNQEAKKASAALRESAQIGSISSWKEGIRPGETLFSYNQESDISSQASSTTFLSGLRKMFNQSSNRLDLSKELSDFFSVSKIHLKAHLKADLKEFNFEKKIASTYDKSFVSQFGEEPEGPQPDLSPVENLIKKRYRLNPVYRTLLQTDIDFFIARQPVNYRITQNQEANLFKKRQLLEKYYDSIRYYLPVEKALFAKTYLSRLAHSELTFTKSFVERVYHQQFKGTLNTMKRLFKLTFDEGDNFSKNRVLSYDQPLYKKSNLSSSAKKESSQTYHPFLHEELFLNKQLSPEEILSSDAQLSLDEQLFLNEVSPFIQESNSTPIYAGWDEKARRFVITNRFNFVE